MPIEIQHCCLRIVRRGGWSWGPDVNALTRGAVKRLPELLAAYGAGTDLDATDDRVIAAPLRVTIPIRLGELAALVAQPGGTDVVDLPIARRLGAALDAVMREQFGVSIREARAGNSTPSAR